MKDIYHTSKTERQTCPRVGVRETERLERDSISMYYCRYAIHVSVCDPDQTFSYIIYRRIRYICEWAKIEIVVTLFLSFDKQDNNSNDIIVVVIYQPRQGVRLPSSVTQQTDESHRRRRRTPGETCVDISDSLYI